MNAHLQMKLSIDHNGNNVCFCFLKELLAGINLC